MPFKLKLFERNQVRPCSRSDSNIMIPCHYCIKCLFHNQEKSKYKMLSTPGAPYKNKTVIMATSIDSIPEWKSEHLNDSLELKGKKEKRRKNKKSKVNNFDIVRDIKVEPFDFEECINNEYMDNITEVTDLYSVTLNYLDNPTKPTSLKLPVIFV